MHLELEDKYKSPLKCPTVLVAALFFPVHKILFYKLHRYAKILSVAIAKKKYQGLLSTLFML